MHMHKAHPFPDRASSRNPKSKNLKSKNPELTSFQSSDFKWILLLTVAAIALWTVKLGNVPLRDWDEGYYAVVARDLVINHHWIYPTRFGAPYFPKPPFGYWLGSLGYFLFRQVNEFTTRLPMAFATALGVPLLYALVRTLSPRRREAISTAGVYMTLLPVVRQGRLHMFDGFINTLLILLLLCLLKSASSRPWAFGMGLCLAAIALTKGILAIALGSIVTVFALLDRRWAVFENPYTWLGLAVGLSLTVGWNVAQYQRYGDIFVQEHLGFHNLARISSTLENNAGPPWYYLLEIVKYCFPWVLFWPGGLCLAWRSRQSTRGRLVLTGTVLFLGMASAMGTKLPWYIMPIYPFMALAVGWQLSRPVEEYAYSLRWVFRASAAVGIGGIVYFAIADPQVPLLLLGACLTITLGWVSRQLTQKSPNFINTLLIGFYSCLMLLMVSHSWIWELNEAFPVVNVGRMVAINVPPGETVYSSFEYGRPSLEFYAEHPIGVGENDTLKQLRQNGHYLLLEQDALDALQISPAEVIESVDGFSLVRP